ncbi:hypothetical protein [Paenibacillus sp. FSL H3-0333]|uniref:hypothetical protein n=1 Tax=Paenibacillus sp. FSL H3-0333 TaxID=2921373 RepID=UPI0030F85DCA
MTKVLPVQKPPVFGYHFYSYPLAIILNYESSYPWFYSNYIQLAFNRDMNAPVPFCFYMYDYAIVPWLTTYRLSREVYALTDKPIVDFVKAALDKEYYVYLNLDEYFVPERFTYGKEHFSHDSLVYGYDSSTRSFHILGFNGKGMYVSSQITFQAFEASFRYLDQMGNECNQIVLYQYKEDGKYDFNQKLVCESLEDYLYSRNTSERFSMVESPWERAYGMEIYDVLLKYFNNLSEGEAAADVRHVHILWEHKHCMKLRTEYMFDREIIRKPHLVEQAVFLEGQALILKNNFLKYCVNCKPELLASIIQLTEDIRELEKVFLPDLIMDMKLTESIGPVI